MKKAIYFLSLCFVFSANSIFAQIDSKWRYLATDNTGIGGEMHESITSDRFGNIWLGGYEIFYRRGSLVRIKDDKYTNWGNYEGFLPDERVHKIVFDNNNHVWVGTKTGVTRFDGKTWKTYTPQNSGLGAEYVEGMAVDRKTNEIWVVSRPFTNPSESRLSVFRNNQWTSFSKSNSGLITNFITDVAVDSNGVKWIATQLGLQKFDGQTWATYNQQNSEIDGPEVLNLKIDDKNQLWCNSGNGSSIPVSLLMFDGSTWQKQGNYPVNNFRPWFFENKNGKQIVTEYGSFARVLIKNGADWEVHIPRGEIFAVHIDSSDNFWMVGKGFVSKYNGNNWTHYTKYNTGMAAYFHEDLFVDSKNRKWLANGNGGIQVFDCNEWRSYGPWNEGLFPSPQMQSTIGTSITEDASNGDIWITYTATNGYSVKIPSGNIDLPNNWVLYDWQSVGSPFFASIEKSLANGKGEIAFVNYSGKAFIHDRNSNTWTYFTTQSEGGPLHANVSNIGTDTAGNFYFGGYRKISKWNRNGTWEIIDLMQQGASQGSVNMIKFDAEDNMWLATTDGLWKWNQQSWQHWDTSNSGITGWNVRSIAFRNNSVYTSAYDLTNWPYSGGFAKFDGQVWESFYQSEHPMTHYQIDDIQFDHLGNLWLMCAEGISIYNADGVKGFECIDMDRDTLDGAMPVVVSGMQDEAKKRFDFEIYPNPVNEVLHIKSRIIDNDAMCRIIDLQGRLLIERKYSDVISLGINVEGLNAGIYLLQMQQGSSVSIVKFIVQ